MELVSIAASLPRLPTKEELERNRLRRKKEEAERMAQYPEETVHTRIAASDGERLKGNEHFVAGRFEEAKKSYDGGFVRLFFEKVYCHAKVM